MRRPDIYEVFLSVIITKTDAILWIKLDFIVEYVSVNILIKLLEVCLRKHI